MYSRSQLGRASGIRLPEHYSGVAFNRANPDLTPAPPAPRPVEYCADGLPGPFPVIAAPPPVSEPTPMPAETSAPAADEKSPPSTVDAADGGLLGSIGGEELLLLGIIFLLAQRKEDDETILLLLLLLLRRRMRPVPEQPLHRSLLLLQLLPKERLQACRLRI